MKNILSLLIILFVSASVFASGKNDPEKSLVLKPSINNMEEVISQLVYPIEARQNAVEGKVTVQFIVDKYGKVVKSTITHACDPLLKSAMDKIVGNFEFSPASIGGEPTAGKLTVPFEFSLEVK